VPTLGGLCHGAGLDFGRLGFVHDPERGKRRTLHALIITRVHSRYPYVHVCHTQTLADFLEGLEDAFAFFGGVPARVVLDNPKAAVTQADRYDPVFARTFAEYAAYRGFVIAAAVARHPQGKPHVERQVHNACPGSVTFGGATRDEWVDVKPVGRALFVAIRLMPPLQRTTPWRFA
jgi:hypothetical protein